MIAYNHYIKFIPELENDKTVKGSFERAITVKEAAWPNWQDVLQWKWTFFNNQGRNIALYSDRKLERSVKSQPWAFDVEGVATFFWNSDELTLHYIPQEKFTPSLLEYWTLHIVLPIFFTVKEYYDFLHAGAVEVDGKPILFVAESFGGKSTMTDFFIKQGHTMISDDKVAVVEKEGDFLSAPSHPHHRPYRNMEDLGFFVTNMALRPKPIHAIYELEKSKSDGEIIITELKGIEKFKTLRLSSEMNISFLKPQRFSFLTKMAKKVPVFIVRVPWNLVRLPEVYVVICKHSRRIK